MRGIVVVVAPPTIAGRLYPRYVQDVGILAVESKVTRPWPFGVDIDGRLVFDLDEQQILANFDLHIPRNRWTKDLGKARLVSGPPGDLVFSRETLDIKSFSLDIKLRTDDALRRLRISIGTKEFGRAVALSEKCMALLAGDELVGFDIQKIR